MQATFDAQTVSNKLAHKFDVLDVVPFGDGLRVYVALDEWPATPTTVPGWVAKCGLVCAAYGVDVARGEQKYVTVK